MIRRWRDVIKLQGSRTVFNHSYGNGLAGCALGVQANHTASNKKSPAGLFLIFLFFHFAASRSLLMMRFSNREICTWETPISCAISDCVLS